MRTINFGKNLRLSQIQPIKTAEIRSIQLGKTLHPVDNNIWLTSNCKWLSFHNFLSPGAIKKFWGETWLLSLQNYYGTMYPKTFNNFTCVRVVSCTFFGLVYSESDEHFLISLSVIWYPLQISKIKSQTLNVLPKAAFYFVYLVSLKFSQLMNSPLIFEIHFYYRKILFLHLLYFLRLSNFVSSKFCTCKVNLSF
jgi:hypothetical protein